MKGNRRLVQGVLLGVGLVLSGCVSVPRAEFGAYQSSFDNVKAGSEDLYLRAGLLAEKIADRPEKEDSVTERRKELETRKAALSARLAALDLVDRYNRVLTGLASGASADDLKGQMTGLTGELSAFNLTQVNRLLEKASPVLSVLSQGVALVEDAVRKKKFQEAVLGAQRPLIGILDILIDDSASLEEIFIQELKREQDPYRKQVGSCGSRFYARIKPLKSTDGVEAALSRQNDIRQKMGRQDFKTMTLPAATAGADPTASDTEALAALSDQSESAMLAYNKIEEKIAAQRAVLKEYRNSLEATKKAFAALPSAIESTRVVATAAFVQQARELRRATLMLQEAK